MILETGNFAARLEAQRLGTEMAEFCLFSQAAADGALLGRFMRGEVTVEPVWMTREGKINTDGEGRQGVRFVAAPKAEKPKANKKQR